jgi:hypothetical protein
MIERELNELKYQQIDKWFSYLVNLVNKTSPDAHTLGQLAEAKATRDLLVHNNGVVNKIYMRKAGINARAKIGERIPLSGTYLADVWRIIIATVNRISEVLIQKS